MSSRALRRIQGGETLVIPQRLSSSEEEDGNVAGKGKNNRNLFDLLGENDSGSEERNSDVEQKTESIEQKTEKEDAKQGAKKKKRKKKKKGGTPEENGKAIHEKESSNAEQEDEVDRGIREANEILGAESISMMKSSSADNLGSAEKPLLFVEHKHLNPDNEMKKIFGSQVVKHDLRQRKRNQRHYRSTWLTIPKPSWPSITKQGLSMEKASSQGEYNYFCYQHSKDYQQVQFKFLDAVESLNPNNIMELVRMYPYHLDSLLQLSDISRMSDDTSMAVELVERALYACESAFHPLFNLTQANCRLDYKSPENRCLFIALFKHIKYVGLRGCNRTALEFCKFLLSLDPDADPLGVLLMIDYYALKSEQYHFLRRLYDEWEAHKNLSQLPNHAFSAALTYFHLSRDEQANIDVADKMLKDALKMFPLVLLPLLEKCSIQPDKEVSTQSIFAAQVGEPPALTQLVTLFVTRNYPLWKEPEVAEWLERNVRELLKGVTAEEDIVSQNRDKRRMRFQRAPRNIYRHIILSDIKDVTVSLPPELANIPVMAFDPLPPKDTIISYTRQTRRVTPANRNGWMSEFFRSLLPSYTPPPPGQVAAGVDLINEDEGAVGGYLAQDTELRMGINALMDSMRDLLNNLQPAEGEEDQEMEEVD
ncbi:ribosome quality control complex subunit TCF25-like isoform X2 [Apostichopus japonicus]|uniref:ribosome quality control complex subunit TCF25-like isoform X2 n=1 Tax=Stichopus japonicus TaxID=307972 RepID=UPI003AB45652